MKRTIVTISVLRSRFPSQSRDLFGVLLSPAGRLCFDYLSPRSVKSPLYLRPSLLTPRWKTSAYLREKSTYDGPYQTTCISVRILINRCLNYEDAGTHWNSMQMRPGFLLWSRLLTLSPPPHVDRRVSIRKKKLEHAYRKGGIAEGGKNQRYPIYEYV